MILGRYLENHQGCLDFFPVDVGYKFVSCRKQGKRGNMVLTEQQKKEKVRDLRPIDDGLHEIFVNTVIDDGTDIAELMSCFTKKEVKNSKFPELSGQIKRLKETEGGMQAVCEVMQKYENLAIQRDHIEKIMKMIQKGYSKEAILDLDYTEEEYLEAEALLLQKS